PCRRRSTATSRSRPGASMPAKRSTPAVATNEIRSVLVLNRGEIAIRICRTLREMGIRLIAVFSDADRDAPHVFAADVAYRLGPAPATQSYLNASKVIETARAAGADAIHPGYGFLAESA